MTSSRNSTRKTPPLPERGSLLFALVFPSLLTLVYFVLLTDRSSATQQGVYGLGKTIQFLFPVIATHFVLRERVRFSWRWREGLLEGIFSGLVMFTIIGALWYVLSMTGSDLLAKLVVSVSAKVRDLGIDTPIRFAIVGLFYSIAHTFLEEYYWRWFVYRRLSKWTTRRVAVAVSSLGFMAHHVILMGVFTGWNSPWTYLFSLAVAVGGAFWAWLYERSRGLVAPWVSHFFVDVAIFSVGWMLIR